jgi:cytidine deaminase
VYCADGKAEDYSMPCGICRQVMAEFNYDLQLILGKTDGSYKVFSLKELLPYAFTPDSLK